MDGLEIQFSENVSRHLQNVCRSCGNVQQNSINLCNPSISVKFRGKRKTFYGEMLKKLTRFDHRLGIKSKSSKKTSEMLQSNYENVLNSWNVSRYLWSAWKCWKWTVSRKMSLWWSRQRAVWSRNFNGFQPFVAFCDFDGVVMNRFSFIMKANQPTNAMKKLHVEAQKARMWGFSCTVPPKRSNGSSVDFRPRPGTIPNHGSRALIMQETCRASFSAISKPIFTTKY